MKTFVTSFPCLSAKPGYSKVGMHLSGSSEPLSIDRAAIEKRLADRNFAWDLREWDPVPSEFFQELPVVRTAMDQWPILTDDKPFLEFYLLRTLRTGEKKMFPENQW